MGTKNYGAESRGDLRNYDADVLILISDPEHALYDKRALEAPDENMIKSMIRYGVIEPVIIALEDEKAIVVAGRRRVLAVREANKRLVEKGAKKILVPCVLRRGSEDSLLGACIVENAHRKEVGFVERGRMASRMLNMGHSKADVAADYGVGVQTLMQWVALDECSAAVKKAVESGQVTMVVALEVAKLPKAEQAAAMGKLTEAGLGKGAAGVVAAKRVRHEDEAALVNWLTGNDERVPEAYEDALKGF